MVRVVFGLAVCALSLCPTSWVMAQGEGAGGLAAPPTPQTIDADAVTSSPAETAAEVREPEEASLGEVPALGEVPPPPPATDGYRRQPPNSESHYAAGRSSVVADSPDLRIPSHTATRLRALDGSLSALAARGTSIVDGVLGIVSGALSIGLGIYVHEDNTVLATYLYVWGGAGIARGIVDVALRPNASRPSIQYAHMPMGTMNEVELRLSFGEEALEQLADRSRLTRILDAAISMGAGAAVVPLYFIPSGFVIDDTFDVFVLIGAGLSLITGTIKLITTSNAERRWSAYEDLRNRLARDETAALEPESSVQFLGAGVGPVEGGATLNVAASF